MATTKKVKETAKKDTPKKEVAVKAVSKEPKGASKKEKYFYAVGRRKTSVARVRLYSQKSLKENEVVINGKNMEEYVTVPELKESLLTAFTLTGQDKGFRVTIVVKGGGIRGQAEAIRLGIARTLVLFDENFHPVLKSAKLLTRDARKVERKKPGLKKARKAPQWAKR